MKNILHDFDNPVKGGKEFDRWGLLLAYVHENKVTGYGVDVNSEVVNFKNGKRPGVEKGTWVPVR